MSSYLTNCLIVSLSPETIHEATEWRVIPCPPNSSAIYESYFLDRFTLGWGGTTRRLHATNLRGVDGTAINFVDISNAQINLPCSVRIDMMSIDLSQSFLSHQFGFADSPDSDKTMVWTPVLDSLVNDVQSRPGLSRYFVFVSFHPMLGFNPALDVATLARATVMASKTHTALTLKEWQGLHNSKHPYDVKFSFGSSSNELWETAEFLQSKSSYWADLFSSGFSESVKKLDLNGQEQVTSDVGVETTKNETNISNFNKGGSKSDQPPSSQGQCTISIHTISIEDEELYHPYRIILCWLRTGEIKFRSLVIDCHPSDEGRADAEPESKAASDVLGFDPVCPKAIYRLAHFLELEQLQNLALRSIVSQIKVENVALELFGQLSTDFDEIHKREFDFAIRNWAVVKKTAGMQSVQQWVKEGRLPNALQTLLDVSLALSSA
ncbi:BQ5605_C018g08651 [Microbotryum silenes-dioicae]|uniref:BQ5605_C018g08651 protein n=1 Tax=Microbotryum silenes-dioicae TaxID=796604 RepID=A0A2X0NUG9_9BASI|nr:BQ5605_C018g08651 [Microbotryum silenes-dioicae]